MNFRPHNQNLIVISEADYAAMQSTLPNLSAPCNSSKKEK